MWWQREVIKEVEAIKEVRLYHEPMDNPPSSNELKEWGLRREAKFFIQGLKAEYEAIKEDVISGAFTSESSDGTAQQVAKAIGRAEQLKDVIFTLEDFGNNGEEDER